MKDPIRVTTMTRYWRAFVRWLTPGEWVVWMLGLSRPSQHPTERGLILIQIDGLSRQSLEESLEKGQMPFLASLLNQEHYENHVMYSGLPSSTASMQAELFYGERQAFPADCYRQSGSGELVQVRRLPETVRRDPSRTQEHFDRSGPPEGNPSVGLLQGGASYCNHFGGGAEEIHFCAGEHGWSNRLKQVSPIKLLVVLVINLWMLARVSAMAILETVALAWQCVSRYRPVREFWEEFVKIPGRVAVVVLLRELAKMGACYDAARGVPLIHASFLGYDEVSHYRGPASGLARWSLRGIDQCVRKIWKSAHRGAGREYDVWVYSAHGQHACEPFERQHNQTIRSSIAQLALEQGMISVRPVTELRRQASRARWLGIRWLNPFFLGARRQADTGDGKSIQFQSSGSIGWIYFPDDLGHESQTEFAKGMVQKYRIPMAIRSADSGKAIVITREGQYQLPEDAIQIFGADHPFLDEMSGDLLSMVHHRDAGDVLLVGWDHDGKSISFGGELGAHAGPGVEETQAFALLPADTHLPEVKRRYLRPDDLRIAALKFMGRDADGRVVPPRPLSKTGRVKILTYNVHACVGMDGQLSPERIARVIAQAGADIICLQELDVHRKRSGHRDQARAIAQHLQVSHQFHPAWHIEDERFGNAILTRFPMSVVEAKGLHHHKEDRSRRSALWVEVDVGQGIFLQVINTHLSIYPTEQRTQAAELVSDWVRPAETRGPVILCGDLNARTKSKTCKILSGALRNVESFDRHPTRSTLFSPFPLTRVDHIFISEGLQAVRTQVISSRLASVASDHLPVMTELRIKAVSESSAGNSVRVAECD